MAVAGLTGNIVGHVNEVTPLRRLLVGLYIEMGGYRPIPV